MNAIQRVVITNTVGQTLIANEVSGNNAELNLSGLAPGVYFLEVIVGDNIAVKKIVKN